MDCLKAVDKSNEKKVGSIEGNKTHFFSFDFRRFETIREASCVRNVSLKLKSSSDIDASYL